jgi:hypothetical protein
MPIPLSALELIAMYYGQHPGRCHCETCTWRRGLSVIGALSRKKGQTDENSPLEVGSDEKL